MDNKRLIDFIESSFLQDLLNDSSITDISYNGRHIFYLHNEYGRCKSEIEVSNDEINNFVRQIANISEKQFSFSNPNLDVSFGKYRLNAVHHSVGRIKNESTITFSLRIGSEELHIERDDGSFFPKAVGELIDLILSNHQSIVIGGETGSGKTELQKYMITRLKENERVIVIDNVLELDNINTDNLDFNVWQSDPNNKTVTTQSLVKNALRNNPDWIIVAESRGEEMIDILNSAMSGHPIVTTIHAFDVKSMPNRMTSMVLMNEKKMSFEEVKEDILYHFKFYFYLKRRIDSDGKVHRYVSSIAIENNKKLEVVYEKKKEIDIYHHYRGDLSLLLDIDMCSELLKEIF